MFTSSYRNSWALIVGINQYKSAPPLSYACNDADSIEKILIGELGFPPKNITLLKNSKATKNNILNTYLDYRNKANDLNDRLLVFYAGHGISIEGLRGPIGYLVPVEGDLKNLNSLIRWDDFTLNAELIPAKHILFIMDACYSGLAIQRAFPPGIGRFISDMLQRSSRQVITAGKADEVVADGGGPSGNNSIFTGYLLEGLKGAASEDGVLTANGLMTYVYRKVGQDERSRQTPHYGHIFGDGDFIFRVPNNEHLIDLSRSDYIAQSSPESISAEQIFSEEKKQVSFAVKNGYGDPTHASFGRNQWSAKLFELSWTLSKRNLSS